jgi:hypothetical protein
MATKQTPADGLVYDAQTHQWVGAPAPAPAPMPPAAPNAKPAAKE